MGESKYAYLLSSAGLFRVNIPDFDLAQQPEFKLESVCTGFGGIAIQTMGMFSPGQDVYLCGGLFYGYLDELRYNKTLYFFNPRKVKEKEYPITDTKLLYKSSVKFESMATPCVLQSKHKTYLFSLDCPSYGPTKSRCCFQSFDPLKKSFCTLPAPPLDNLYEWYDASGYFIVYDHIYLFLRGGAKNDYELHAFSFNTISSKWKEIGSMVRKFEKHNIPLPYCHNGDIGLSHKFDDNTQILVALNGCTPTAYRVRLGAAGSSLRPKSYRGLLKRNYYGFNDCSHLLDIGSQRFCVILSGYGKHIFVYAFKMDFAVEYENQRNSTSDAMPSIEILCSKKFFPSIVNCVCLAYAPASQRCVPWDKPEPGDNNSDDRKPGVVFLEM